VVGGQQRQQVRDRQDLRRGLVPVAAADLEQRERARLARGPLRLRRGDLHRLVARLDHPELVADEHREQDRRDQHDQRQPRRPGEHALVAAVAQLPRRDGEHHRGAGVPRCQQHL
jgi:hypothetical protein